MSNHLNKRISDERLSTTRSNASLVEHPKSVRQPWLSSNAAYFIFAATVAGIVFFVVFYALSEHSEDSPVVAAGLSASAVMLVAVFAREVVVRRARTKYLLQSEYQEINIVERPNGKRTGGSFSLEQNASAMRELKKVSAQAVSLATAQAHLDVVRAASTYLRRAEKYLPSVVVGSPSLAALRSGQEKAREIHRFHLLAWAASESQTLAKSAAIRVTTDEKIETANRALSVLDSALEQYPYETVLNDSRKYIKDFIVTTRIKDYIEMAERDAFKEKFESAIDYYKDALFTLSREELDEDERSRLNAEINAKITEIENRRPDKLYAESE